VRENDLFDSVIHEHKLIRRQRFT